MNHQSNILAWVTMVIWAGFLTIIGLYLYSNSISTDSMGYYFKEGYSPRDTYIKQLKKEIESTNTVSILEEDMTLEEKLYYVAQLEAIYTSLDMPYSTTDVLIDSMLDKALEEAAGLDDTASLDDEECSEDDTDSEFGWY